MMGNTKRLLPILLLLVSALALACGEGGVLQSSGEATREPEPSSAESAPPEQAAEPAAVQVQEPETAEEPPQVPALESGGVFRRLWADPPTLDPHLTTDTTSAGIVVEVFSGLMAFNTELQLVPDIAEEVKVEDGVVYTFTLRNNARFHNGKPVTASDFKWSLERSADPKTASPVADTYLGDIVGIEEYMNGEASEISGVTVIDDHTLQITIDAPKVYFLAKMTYPTSYVLDREVVEAGGRNWWVSRPVGTGPFELKEYRIGERIVLERFDDYYREPAGVTSVTMGLAGGQAIAMYENDEIDITGVGLFDIDRILDPEEPLNRELVVVPPDFSISYIGFNTSPLYKDLPNPLSDAKFRQALNHSVDKDLIASEVYSGLIQPAQGILPPGFPGFSEAVEGLEFDPELARNLLDESEFADPDSRPRIVVTVPGTGGNIGLYLEVILEVEWATYLEDLDNQEFQAFAGLGWEADYPDPQDFLDILFHSESSLNHGAYSNLAVDEVLEDARVEQDPIARMSLYRQAEQMIVDDAAWVPLWLSGDQYVLIKPHIKGFKMTPMIVPKLKQVWIEG
jgi:oligopeptide transport system substrate-binding protein